MSQNQQRRGRRPPISSGRGRRPPISSGQPQQQTSQNYQQQQQPQRGQQQRGGGRNNRSKGRGRGGGASGNQRYPASNQPQQQQNYDAPQNPVSQQGGGGRKRKAPMKNQQNQQIFEQFSAQPQQQQEQIQQIEQAVQPQQSMVDQNREEEKQAVEQVTAGGPSSQSTQQQQGQRQQSPQKSPKKIQSQPQRNNRQPPWIEFTGADKKAPIRCGWAHRVRQVLSADTLRVALLKPRKSNPLLPPEIIQITLEGIQAPRTQKYDAEKSKALINEDRNKEKRDKKKRKKDRKQAERKEKEKQEDKKDDKDKKDTKGDDDKGGKNKDKGGDKKGNKNQQKKGGKKEQTEQKEKDKGDKSDKSKPKKKKDDQQQQQQQYQYQPLDEDQPFAYEAREFVRKKVMNKNVFYAVWRINSNQTSNRTAPVRYWGDIYYIENNQTKSLTRELVAAGYASVKQSTNNSLEPKERAALKKKEEKARDEKKNIWSYNPDTEMHKVQNKIRIINWIPYELQKKFGDTHRNKTLKGVVDQVISGSTIRVELKTGNNQFSNIVVNIAGVNAPKVKPLKGFPKKNPRGREWSETDKLNQFLSTKFGVESREWTEERLLGQYVGVKILFVSNGQIIAQINHDKGRIGPSLLKKGLAQYESWSANLCDPEEKQTLKSAADFAIKNNLQICNAIKNQGTRFNKFEKKVTVIQVISGDTVLVEEQFQANKTRQIRYTLSSIRAPILRYRTPKKPGDSKTNTQRSPAKSSTKSPTKSNDNNNNDNNDKKKGKSRGGAKRRGAGQNKAQSPSSRSSIDWEVHPDEYLARDAKEFVRKSCIGKQVLLRYEYSRYIDSRGKKGNTIKKEKKFATIYYTNDKGKQTNLALALIKKGLVDLVVHGKAETNRSEEYWKLEEAWNNARAKKPHPPGLFQFLTSDKGFVRPNDKKRKEEALKYAIQDYSGVDDDGIKTHDLIRLNQFLKNNRVKAVVEFVFGGNRVKVYIPQRKVCIAVRLADVRVGDWNISGPKASEQDPLRVAAKALLEKTILQRDVEVLITSTGQEMNQQKQSRGQRKRQGGGQSGKGGQVVSRNPNLDGHIFINGQNISEELLSQGLATVIRRRYESDRTAVPPNFKRLEQKAKDNKVGFWKNYSEDGYLGDSKTNEQELKKRKAASMTGKEAQVVVSHIETASLFYVNDANSDAMHKMTQELEKLKTSRPKIPKQIRPGKAVRFAAKYDGHYARCRVNNRADPRPNQQQQNDQNNKKGGKGGGKNNDQDSNWFVLFIDYGNKGRIPRGNFAELPAELRIDRIPPLAMKCQLAGITVYEKNQAAFNAAGFYFSDYVFQSENQKLNMKILYDDQYNKTWHVELYVGDKSINQLIAREGYVTLTKDRDLPREFANQQEHGEAWSDEHKLYVKQYFDAIKENIRLAKDDHKNIWYHGDVDSADDDDNLGYGGSKKAGNKRGR